ncbi:unnamed protein product [Paramecium pentaurelia]|uniref:PARP-type domain-containing protein n=1 Tax=Paramecium pentaurelia TaxID=43138 RepID=A0A8S1YII5_9CILI|nr:unnamed protein product [Paramecium pentaurelia]
MEQNIEVGYALSNRVKCHFQNIIKDDIRIGHVLARQPGLSFEKKLWYHLNSLNSIKGDKNQDLDILNIHGLNEEDQKKVRQKVDQIMEFQLLKKYIKQINVVLKVIINYKFKDYIFRIYIFY